MQRAFADVDGREVHYRHAGAGEALLLLHASPGSARGLAALGDALAVDRRVIAPDRAGNGDSAALPMAAPEIADYARAELALLDALGIGACDIYGMHTGACVAAEMAILAPLRVRRVVLDGFSLFSAAEKARFLAHYAPLVKPDRAGAYLAWAFGFIRDQALFFPWFDARAETARGVGLPEAGVLHVGVVELLKAIETYHLGYHASFRWDGAARLGLVGQPALAITAPDDPLHGYLAPALGLLPDGVTAEVPALRGTDRAAGLARVIRDFLGGG